MSVCIMDRDMDFVKAFARVVAIDHAGCSLTVREACGADCPKGFDACLCFCGTVPEAVSRCECACLPRCGKYAGVSAILAEARAFALDRRLSGRPHTGFALGGAAGACVPNENALICVYACAGGIGTSCAAVGIGRELARYRSENVIYVSLEDAEDAALFPDAVCAMPAEEVLYRYLRLAGEGAPEAAYGQLFHAAAGRDEYGLYRLAPDEGVGGFAGLAPCELHTFLFRLVAALGLTRIVLDFGTRLRFLAEFVSELADTGEALVIEALCEIKSGRKRRPVFSGEMETAVFPAVFPICEDDVRGLEGRTDVGLANAFGLTVKEVCDRITGDGI